MSDSTTPQDDAAMSPASDGSALALAIRFHEAYERLAPRFGYDTRPETRNFDPQTNNGRLMVAVCREIIEQNGKVEQPRTKGFTMREEHCKGSAPTLGSLCLGSGGDDRSFLSWIHARLCLVHGENELVDYMHRLRCIVVATPPGQRTPNDGRGGNSQADLTKEIENSVGECGGWITVSERLPPPGIEVLVAVKDLGMDIGYVAVEDHELGWHWEFNASFDGHATHWMPLPSCPNERTPKMSSREPTTTPFERTL
jgi:hypothetical protein